MLASADVRGLSLGLRTLFTMPIGAEARSRRSWFSRTRMCLAVSEMLMAFVNTPAKARVTGTSWSESG